MLSLQLALANHRRVSSRRLPCAVIANTENTPTNTAAAGAAAAAVYRAFRQAVSEGGRREGFLFELPRLWNGWTSPEPPFFLALS